MALPALANWPVAKAPSLATILASLQFRFRSLIYTLSECEISVSSEIIDGREREQLALKLANHLPIPDRLTMVFCDDGTMWLDCRRAAKVGWEYEFSFRGDTTAIDPNLIPNLIQQSLWISVPSHMETVWSRCKLRRERSMG